MREILALAAGFALVAFIVSMSSTAPAPPARAMTSDQAATFVAVVSVPIIALAGIS